MGIKLGGLRVQDDPSISTRIITKEALEEK
jgi:hypothetical protein